MFGRKDGKGGYVNMAVLSESNRKLKWFTCHGVAFDSVQLQSDEYNQIITETIDPFTFYRNYCSENLFYIEQAEIQYRLNGKAALQDTSHNSRIVYNSIPVRSAQSTLQKLVAMEGLMKRVCLQLQLFESKAPLQLAIGRNDSIRIWQDMAGIMIRKADSTEYFNTDPLSSAARIVLHRHSPGRLFVYKQNGTLLDSVPLKSGKYASLLKEKEDVFLLYRGWLELQWQQVMDEKRQYAAWLRRLDSSLYRSVSSEQNKQLQNIAISLQEQQIAIGDKISSLIVPEGKHVGRLVGDFYRNETSEISYLPGLGFAYTISYIRGHKTYELTDHRGNVMAVVSDKKKGIDENTNGTVEYYNADIVNSSDYYPFGALMPGRTFSAGDKYRYGYNGKENDSEVKGEGNQLDYGMRIYDPRIGRFLSVDPLQKYFPWYTPYQFAGNNPIKFIDLDGLEPVDVEIVNNQIVYSGGFIVNTDDIYRITFLNVILGMKLPDNLNTSSNPYVDGDPYNRSTWEKAYQNVSYFFKHHAPAYSRSEAATKTIHNAVVQRLFSGNSRDAELAIEQIDKSENYTYRNSLAEDGVFYASLVNGFRTIFTKPKFFSSDPLVQSTVNAIESAKPGSVYAVESIIKNPITNKTVTDFDIILEKHIIEVTGGSGKGKLSQIQERIQGHTKKEVILFGPNIGVAVEKSLKNNNIKVFKNVDDLIKYINPK